MAAEKSGLQWILAEAKRLKKQYPNRFKTWKEYVAQATAIYHSKKGDSVRREKSRTKKRASVETRKRRSSKKVVVSKKKILTAEKRLQERLKKDKQRLPHGYELVPAKRLIVSGMVGMTLNQLKSLLHKERLRLKHGYDIVRRKRISGIIHGDEVDQMLEELRFLHNHYDHVISELDLLLEDKDMVKFRRDKLKQVKRLLQRHDEYIKSIFSDLRTYALV